jgi:trigger factor
MPGFGPQVVGMTANETRKFDLAFPEDYANESLRGQMAHLEVTCKEVKSRTLPEWSDELAKELGEYENLDDMRAKVRQALERQASRQIDQDYAQKVMDQLTEQAKINYPPNILESEIDGMIEDLDVRLREQRLTLDDYLKIQAKTKEQLREEVQPQAIKRLKRSLVLGEVINREKISLTPDELQSHLGRYMSAFGDDQAQMRQALASERVQQAIVIDILSDKALERVAALAKGEDIPLPADPPAAEATPVAETAAA